MAQGLPQFPGKAEIKLLKHMKGIMGRNTQIVTVSKVHEFLKLCLLDLSLRECLTMGDAKNERHSWKRSLFSTL